jgi:hypothetical protein
MERGHASDCGMKGERPPDPVRGGCRKRGWRVSQSSNGFGGGIAFDDAKAVPLRMYRCRVCGFDAISLSAFRCPGCFYVELYAAPH